MKTVERLGLTGLLVVVVLALASCGAVGGSAGGDQNGGMQGMDHKDRDKGSMGPEETSRRMLQDESGEYSDRRFIDKMVPHHQGAVEMAEVALRESEREEIQDLSRDIVRTQEAEIEELKSIKQDEFGTSRIPMDMGEGEMDSMGMVDGGELADQRPFDKAFIDAMIPHHRSAIGMARVAGAETRNPRIRDLSDDIAAAQKREISQMEQWREEWYPQG